MVRLRAILGAGGTGKSYLINQMIQENASFGFRSATTGIAAVNMGTIAGAQSPTTINSALSYYNAESLLRNYHKGLTVRPLTFIASQYKNIIIDEISMMDGGTLDVIVLAIQSFNENFKKDLGLIVCGDPGQLPPVTGKPFFQAKSWPLFKVEFLTEVKRQKNQDFIEALNLVRVGKAEEAADYFKDKIEFTPTVANRFRGTTFFPTNNEVDIYNRKCLNRLIGKSQVYHAEFKGKKKDPTWKSIPQFIELKVGCLIQLLYNDFSLGFANGDTAIVEELWDNCVFIGLLRRNKSLFLRPRELKYFTFNTKGFRNARPDGVLTLIHARLAYALTIHKAQGLTLDAVQINLTGVGSNFLSRQSGMLYTALSRVRSPEGLKIVGDVDDLVRCCYVDPVYKEWIK